MLYVTIVGKPDIKKNLSNSGQVIRMENIEMSYEPKMGFIFVVIFTNA